MFGHRYALTLATYSGNINKVREIINTENNDFDDLNTYLIIASMFKDKPMMKLMKQNGANEINLTNKVQFFDSKQVTKAMDLLIRTGEFEFYKYIKKEIVSIDLECIDVSIDEVLDIISDWNRLLREACFRGNMKYIKYALANGADDVESGLSIGCCIENIDIVRLMIARGAHNWNTAVIVSTVYKKIVPFVTMIANGADDYRLILTVAHSVKFKDLISLLEGLKFTFYKPKTFMSDLNRESLAYCLVEKGSDAFMVNVIKLLLKK